jgi:hypothetical protein
MVTIVLAGVTCYGKGKKIWVTTKSSGMILKEQTLVATVESCHFTNCDDRTPYQWTTIIFQKNAWSKSWRRQERPIYPCYPRWWEWTGRWCYRDDESERSRNNKDDVSVPSRVMVRQRAEAVFAEALGCE